MKRISIGTWAYTIGPYVAHPVPFDEVVQKLAFHPSALQASLPAERCPQISTTRQPKRPDLMTKIAMVS